MFVTVTLPGHGSGSTMVFRFDLTEETSIDFDGCAHIRERSAGTVPEALPNARSSRISCFAFARILQCARKITGVAARYRPSSDIR